MKRTLVLPLLAWELVVLGCLSVIMFGFGKPMNQENGHHLEIVAGLGLFVVLFCWPICRRLPKAASFFVGAVIGLLAPPLCAWAWAWLLPFPWWTGPAEIKLLGMVLPLPSAIGGMVVGGLQARRAIPLGVPNSSSA